MSIYDPLREFRFYREAHPERSVQWCLEQVRKRSPKSYGKMPLRTLVVKYQEAKRTPRSGSLKRTQLHSCFCINIFFRLTIHFLRIELLSALMLGIDRDAPRLHISSN
jgi:hypothetical protein